MDKLFSLEMAITEKFNDNSNKIDMLIGTMQVKESVKVYVHESTKGQDSYFYFNIVLGCVAIFLVVVLGFYCLGVLKSWNTFLENNSVANWYEFFRQCTISTGDWFYNWLGYIFFGKTINKDTRGRTFITNSDGQTFNSLRTTDNASKNSVELWNIRPELDEPSINTNFINMNEIPAIARPQVELIHVHSPRLFRDEPVDLSPFDRRFERTNLNPFENDSPVVLNNSNLNLVQTPTLDSFNLNLAQTPGLASPNLTLGRTPILDSLNLIQIPTTNSPIIETNRSLNNSVTGSFLRGIYAPNTTARVRVPEPLDINVNHTIYDARHISNLSRSIGFNSSTSTVPVNVPRPTSRIRIIDAESMATGSSSFLPNVEDKAFLVLKTILKNM